MPCNLFLDRDGTIIEHIPYLHDPAGVRLLLGVKEALAAAKARGDKLFLFTNQSGVGRGMFTLADAEACNARMLELLGLGDDLFTGVCVAPEAPGEPSRYRKPKPDFILETIDAHGLDPSRCIMIGDAISDWKAGLNAGITALAVTSDLTTEKSEGERRALGVPHFPGLAEAMASVVGCNDPRLDA